MKKLVAAIFVIGLGIVGYLVGLLLQSLLGG